MKLMRNSGRLSDLTLGFVLALLLPSLAWSQQSDPGAVPPSPDPAAEEGFPLSPPDGIAWLFFDPQAPDAAAVRAKVREVAWSLGYNTKEFDLSRSEYFDLLSDIVLSRGFRRVAPMELFVGDRHLAGSAAIARFLDGWKAGTEILREEAAAPATHVVPVPPAVEETPKEAAQAGAGASAATEVDADPGPAQLPPVDPGTGAGKTPALVQTEAPQLVIPPPSAPSRGAFLEWLKRYKLSALAILAAIAFFALSVRRGQPGN